MPNFMGGNLSANVKIHLGVGVTSASATGAINSTIIDMLGYEGCLGVVDVGTANSSITFKAQVGSATASMGDLADSLVTCRSTGGVMYLDVSKTVSTSRYLRFVLTREAATKAGSIWTFRYGARSLPVSNSVTDVSTGRIAAGKSTGTA